MTLKTADALATLFMLLAVALSLGYVVQLMHEGWKLSGFWAWVLNIGVVLALVLGFFFDSKGKGGSRGR